MIANSEEGVGVVSEAGDVSEPGAVAEAGADSQNLWEVLE